MVTNRLKINDRKTELLIVGSCQQLSKVQLESVTVGDSENKPISTVPGLGAGLDKNLSMSIHVSKVYNKVCRGLYSIRQIRKYLSGDATKVLVHAFVTSRLDYCNSLLFGIPKYPHDRLQRILSAATRIVCLVPKFSHHTPVLYNLDWLPESYQIQLKILLPVHLVCYTVVFSVVTQLSFPQTAPENRTTFLSRG